MKRSSAEPKVSYWFPKPYADFVQRLRVPLGFVLLVGFGWLSRPSAGSLLLGLPIAVLGLLLRGWAGGHLAKDQQLATSGPYAYLRNPLYVGTLIVAGGLVVASRNVSLAVLFAAAFLLVYLPAVELEEQHLREIFADYGDYARRVSRFVPRSRYRGISRNFSWSLYQRNQEYKAAMGFLVATAWLLIKYVFLP
ncbi:MAG: methyltransferase family protein [Bryobacteraceae bacterium]